MLLQLRCGGAATLSARLRLRHGLRCWRCGGGATLPAPPTPRAPPHAHTAWPPTHRLPACCLLSLTYRSCLPARTHNRYGSLVAAKILKGSNEIALGDFRGEIEILRKVHHPYAVQVRQGARGGGGGGPGDAATECICRPGGSSCERGPPTPNLLRLPHPPAPRTLHPAPRTSHPCTPRTPP